MANVNRGEVGFTGLDGKEYIVSFSTNALCELDDKLGVENAFEKVLISGKATLKQYRAMFFIALRDRGRHPEIVDEIAAADLVIYEDMMALLSRAIEAQHPKATAEAKASREKDSSPIPPQPGQ